MSDVTDAWNWNRTEYPVFVVGPKYTKGVMWNMYETLTGASALKAIGSLACTVNVVVESIASYSR